MTENKVPETDPILITGATGFTGGALAKRLREMGRSVRALVRPSSDSSRLTAWGVELVEGDLTSRSDVDRAVSGCGVVFHIGAAFRTAKMPDSYYHEVHVEGTQYLIDAARREGCERLVHCSTVGVHGHVSQIPGNEESPYNPGDIYQDTKLEGEKRAQEAIEKGQPICIVRPAGIYGPGDMRFLKLFRTIQNRTFFMFGSGEVPYHFTYIDDLVDGFVLCGRHPKALGEIFIIGGDEYVSLNELVELVAGSVGVAPPRTHLPLAPLLLGARVCEAICRPLKIEPPLHMRRCEFFVKARAFSNAKARELLGYRPSVPLPEGIRRTASWYQSQGLLR